MLPATLSPQVYQTLEKLRAAPAELATGHSPSSPQENSYMSAGSGVHVASRPWPRLAAPSEALVQSSAERLQHSPNQPVESDESIGGLSSALHSCRLAPSRCLGPPSLQEASCTQGGAVVQPNWGSGLGLQPTAAEGNSGPGACCGASCSALLDLSKLKAIDKDEGTEDDLLSVPSLCWPVWEAKAKSQLPNPAPQPAPGGRAEGRLCPGLASCLAPWTHRLLANSVLRPGKRR